MLYIVTTLIVTYSKKMSHVSEHDFEKTPHKHAMMISNDFDTKVYFDIFSVNWQCLFFIYIII